MKILRGISVLGLFLSLASIGCGGGTDDGDNTLSCSDTLSGTLEFCSLYTHVSDSGVAGLKSGCTASGVATVGTSCPTTGVLGTCTNKLAGSSFEEVESVYIASGTSALMSQCAQEGGTYATP